MIAKKLDLVTNNKRYKGDIFGFYLDLKRWKSFKTRYDLSWTKTRFVQGGHASVPNERGIYLFTVELSPSKLPAHGYILYVGEAGQDSNNTLRKRYNQYLREWKTERGRARVRFMIDNWREDLFFNYVTLPDTKVDLRAIEKKMLNALMPPVNERDFDGYIMAARKAAI